MIRKAKYNYKCPRCGVLGGSDLQLSTPPWCSNYEGHHSNRDFVMELVPELSKNVRPPTYSLDEKAAAKKAAANTANKLRKAEETAEWETNKENK